MASNPKQPSDERGALAAQPEGAERRIHERIVVDFEVDYCAADTFLFAFITDISVMGIFIRTNSPEPPGTRLNLSFPAPDGQVLRLQGEVVWINPWQPGESHNPGMGVQFVDLSPEQRSQVMELVKTFAYLEDPGETMHD